MQPPAIPDNEEERLAALTRLNVLDTPTVSELDRVVELLAKALDTPMALVSLVDTDRQWFKAKIGLDASETSREVSFCGHAILSDEIFVVNDATADPRFAANPLVLDDPNIRFYAGAPLVTSDGHRIGTLCAIDNAPRDGLSTSEREILRVLAHTVVDRLELDQARAELDKRSADLERYEAIINASTDMVGVAGLDGTVSMINPAGRALIGIPSDADVSQMSIADCHPPEVAARILSEGIPAAAVTGVWHGETALQSADGSIIPIDQVVLAHRTADGEIAYFSTVARDISDRAEIQRLLELQRLKDEFVSTVSHELRTPLTSIYGSLSLLAGGAVGSLSPEATELVTMASNNSLRLTRLVNDILDLEKMRSGKLQLELAEVNTRAPLMEAMRAVEALATNCGITLICDCHLGDETKVRCDAPRITQVFVNLLGNAIKFSPNGSEVTIRTSVVGDEACIRVIDRGAGIREADIGKLFEPFWQADSSDSRNAEGTGLGLAICHGIIERHGGRIEVTSALGEGTEFAVWLPLVGPDLDEE